MSETTASIPATRDLGGVTIPAPGTFAIDASHSTVQFVARHMMVSKVRGSFDDYSGTITIAEDPLQSSVEVALEAASVNTRDETRDGHLKSADFFDADNHPKITFRSTGVKQRSETELTVTGDLTIRGITKPVSMQVQLIGAWDTAYWESKDDDWKNFGPVRRIGFTGTLTVNRHDWGVSWQDEMDNGGIVVSDEIELRLDVEALSDEDVQRAEREAKDWKAA